MKHTYKLLLVIFTFSIIQGFSQSNGTFRNQYNDKNFSCQLPSLNRISVDKEFTPDKGSKIISLKSKEPIYGLSIDAVFNLENESSLIRVILVDNKYNEYLIYEAYSLLANKKNFSLNNGCEETCLLNTIVPSHIEIVLVDASIKLNSIHLSTSLSKSQLQNLNELKKEQLIIQNKAKVAQINETIREKGDLWIAGETPVSQKSFAEKKALFDDNQAYNLNGFEYYKGGIFTLKTKNKDQDKTGDLESEVVESFDWRTRHGKTGVGWMTPARDQLGCGSCSFFANVGALEGIINLYYNTDLNYDLSEQYLVSCLNSNGCRGVCVSEPAEFIINNGIITEESLPYVGVDASGCSYSYCGFTPVLCSDADPNPDDQIYINNLLPFFRNQYENPEDGLKKMIIKNGPMVGSVVPWSHAMTLVGFGRVTEENEALVVYDTKNSSSHEKNSSIGETYYIFKNSWGDDWGENGFVKLVFENFIDLIALALEPIVQSQVYNDNDILCADNDGDGYYNWGISENKPAHCPTSHSLKDGDDSNPYLGPIDENGKFINYSFPHIEDFSDDNITWTNDPDYSQWTLSRECDGNATYQQWTGPSCDHTGYPNGFYYTNLQENSLIYSLFSPIYNVVDYETFDISFWYHMYGWTMGNLYVDVSMDGGSIWYNIYSIEGEQQTSHTDPWLRAEINLNAYKSSQTLIRFRGHRINGWSDISIDDIIVNATKTAPNISAKNIVFDNIQPTSLNLLWEQGNGENVLVLAREGSAINSNPVESNSYSGNAEFGLGQQIGSGNYVLYSGPTKNNLTVTGLKPNTTFHFRVYDFNNTGTYSKYNINTATNNPKSVVTGIIVSPADQAKNVSIASLSSSAIEIEWENGNGTGRYVFISKVYIGSPSPVDYINYSASTTYGQGGQIGSSGWYCVYNGSENYVIVTGLNANDDYRVMVCEYNNVEEFKAFNTQGEWNNPNNTEKVYWCDDGTNRIVRSDPEGKDVSNVITTGLSVPQGIALDITAGKVYWCDDAYNKIYRANLDGSGKQTIAYGLSQPKGIALNIENQKVYWCDQGTNKVQRKNMDGTGSIEDIITSINDPNGIDIDLLREKIYVSDYYGLIYRANLDGSDLMEVVTNGISDSYDVTVDMYNQQIYFNDCGRLIRKTDYNGENNTTVYNSGSYNMRFMDINSQDGKMYITNKTKIVSIDLNKQSAINIYTSASNATGIVVGGGENLVPVSMFEELAYDDGIVNSWINIGEPFLYGDEYYAVGFNVSQNCEIESVKTYLKNVPGNTALLNMKITGASHGFPDIRNVIASKAFVSESSNTSGSWISIVPDNPVSINANEDFFVLIGGARGPQSYYMGVDTDDPDFQSSYTEDNGNRWNPYSNDYMIRTRVLISGNKKSSVISPNTKGNTEQKDVEQFIQLEELVRLYPNPSNGQVYIESVNEAIVTIEIRDLSGKIIFQKLSGLDSLTEIIDLLDSSKGIYIAVIRTESDIYNKKFIIN